MFADPVDKASQVEEEMRQRSIEAARTQQVRVKPTGYCHNCAEAVEQPKLFCDPECSEDYERVKRAERMR